MMAGHHVLIADEPEEIGGNDFGPFPYEYLKAALGACIAMTLQMFARRRKWGLREVNVHLSFVRVYRHSCGHCDSKDRRLESFDRDIELKGNVDESQKNKINGNRRLVPGSQIFGGQLKNANQVTEFLGASDYLPAGL